MSKPRTDTQTRRIFGNRQIAQLRLSDRRRRRRLARKWAAAYRREGNVMFERNCLKFARNT